MTKFIILVSIGGALGAMLREFAMLVVPNLADGFPLDRTEAWQTKLGMSQRGARIPGESHFELT